MLDHIEDRQRLPVRPELLHTIIVKLRDEQLIRRINCDADGRMKLARRIAFALAAELEDEPRLDESLLRFRV